MPHPPAVLGVDLGGTGIKWARGTGLARAWATGQIATPRTGPGDVVRAIAALATAPRPAAIGVGVPGHLTDDRRGTRLIPNLPGQWAGFPLAAELEAQAGAPVTLVNDARAFARAELAIGAAADLRDAIFVTIGTGVGGAIALDGRILRGRGDRVGELGHMSCRPGGARCGCGAHGCLETVVSGTAIATRLRTARTATATATATADVTAEDVVRAAEQGDPLARETLHDAGRALGRVLGDLTALLAISTVVVGGGVAPALDLMRPAIDTELAARRDLVGPVEIRRARLGRHAGAMGAALEAALQPALQARPDTTTGARTAPGPSATPWDTP